MTSVPIDNSMKVSAKLVGIAYLTTFIIVVTANYAIYDPLHVAGNATETAKRIFANQHWFRFGIVLDLVYAIGFTILVLSLHTILQDVNRRLSILACVWYLVYIITWVVLTLKFFDALRLASGAKYLQVFADENSSALARLFLFARFDRYYGVLLFYSMGSTLFNFLWLKSGYIPRALALWGIIACAWCAICAAVYLVYPDFEKSVNLWAFDLPMALFDMTLSVWLLIKGLKAQTL